MRVEVLTARSLTLNMCALKLRLLDCALQLHGWTRSKPSHIAAHLYYTLVSHLLLWQEVLKSYFMKKKTSQCANEFFHRVVNDIL